MHGVEEKEEFALINNKLKSLMKLVTIFLSCSVIGGFCGAFVKPLLENERKLFFVIGFPLDWRNDEFAYWMAVAFIFTHQLVVLQLYPLNLDTFTRVCVYLPCCLQIYFSKL